MSWTRNGNRYHKVSSRGGRFSPPKVHVEMRYPEIRAYWPICVPGPPSAFGLGWYDEPDDAEVTCKKCLHKADYWKKRGT